MDEPAEHGNSPAPCRKKARVTDIGDGIEQLKAVNEAAAGLAAVGQLEGRRERRNGPGAGTSASDRRLLAFRSRNI
ncbi:hypothetical protein IB244_01120 [Rhizobium sp. RHZ02]|nr:hypothetical protein [Rhizobium sp. RHZ02]